MICNQPELTNTALAGGWVQTLGGEGDRAVM